MPRGRSSPEVLLGSKSVMAAMPASDSSTPTTAHTESRSLYTSVMAKGTNNGMVATMMEATLLGTRRTPDVSRNM